MIQKSILAGIFFTGLIYLIIFGQDTVVPVNNTIVSSALMPAGSAIVMPDSLNSFQISDSNIRSDAGCLQTEPDLFRMPIYKPDSSLTTSMPVLIPPPVDEGMILPIDKPSSEQCE